MNLRMMVNGVALVIVFAPLAHGGPDPVIEISHRRTACYGTCPVYTVTFRNDGTARLEGEANLTPLGQSEGAIRREDFDRLVALADKVRFFGLKPTYGGVVLDAPMCHTTVSNGKETKKVQTYCERSFTKGIKFPPGGPPVHEPEDPPEGLLSLEKALDALRKAVVWKPVGATRP
jgi:hypothetical protein